MRKQLLAALTALCVLLGCAVIFTGCGKGSGGGESAKPSSSSQQSSSKQSASSGSGKADTGSKQGDLTVYYLDVGQGDSELIFLPDGTTILIDCGEIDFIQTITKALKDYGVKKIDILIATHPHSDHIGCMATVVRNFYIGEVYMPRIADNMTPTLVCYEKLLEAIDKKNIPLHTGKAGTVAYDKNGVKLEFFGPKRSYYERMNDYSIVAKLTYGDTAFLFMGDAEWENLNEVVNGGYDLKCDVLKLGHHGSSDGISDRFMKKARPQYGIISCARDNAYGHPHRETVALLKDYNVTSYRTYEDGSIRAVSDGKTVQVTPGLPSVPAA